VPVLAAGFLSLAAAMARHRPRNRARRAHPARGRSRRRAHSGDHRSRRRPVPHADPAAPMNVHGYFLGLGHVS